jgi:hypothetical protein
MILFDIVFSQDFNKFSQDISNESNVDNYTRLLTAELKNCMLNYGLSQSFSSWFNL